MAVGAMVGSDSTTDVLPCLCSQFAANEKPLLFQMDQSDIRPLGANSLTNLLLKYFDLILVITDTHMGLDFFHFDIKFIFIR